MLNNVLGSSKSCLIVAVSLVGRDSYLTTSGLDGTCHLVVVVGQRTSIDGSAGFEHLGSPTVCTCTVGVGAGAQLRGCGLALADDIVVAGSLC